MLYICIPTYNEGPTVGVLLWRIRRVFQDYSREYEIIVYDDGSTDGTRETVEPYAEVIPLTVLRGEERKGFGFAIDKLVREALSRRTRYARRDALIMMQADFTDQPEHIPELVKRFEGGADIVAAKQEMSEAPAAVQRLRRFADWIQRAGLPKTDADPFTTYRLYRISVLREMLKTLGDKPVVTSSGWAANAELLLKARRFARRLETVDLAPRYDVRTRETRVRPFADALNLFRFSRRARVLAAAAKGAG